MGTRTRIMGAGLALVLAGTAPGMASGTGVSTPNGTGATTTGSAAASTVAGGPATVLPDDGGGGVASPLVRDGVYTVTLVTGDVIRYEQRDGKVAVTPSAVPRPDGVRPQLRVLTWDDHTFVIPTDVAHLVGDQLDRRLFDVTALIASGYDDASSDRLPVIVQTAASTTGQRGRGVAWGALGVDKDRTLAAVDGISGTLSKQDKQGHLVEAVKDSRQVQKIWLDGRVRASLAESVPQVGAPQAWAAGFTGEGVRVAVLDSGVDSDHPDLADAVVEEQDFTGAGSADDVFGHGTHVAGIITGNGAASDGQLVGVAPDAQIMNGRVLDDTGSGAESWIIAGMEWAAAGDADVINMSLGAPVYIPGDDPMSLAVDELSATHDTLFVIAAGNDGGYGTINAPGSAASALTVAAVDDADQATFFTSRGPRADGGAKPDITAPGEEILAANVGYPESTDEPYARHSGTSMATPHVAGVAALVLQARPDLTWAELKSILVGSADDVDQSVFDVGSGRVFAPSAIDADAYTLPSALGFGIHPFPQDGLDPVTQTLTYHSTSDADQVLTLSAGATLQDGSPAPAGALTLSADTVALPAGGSVEVQVTVDPAAVPNGAGRVGGMVVATDADGGTVRTAVMSVNEIEMFDLTIVGTDRDGSPAGWDDMLGVTPLELDDPELAGQLGFDQVFPVFDETGTAHARLPRGTYGVMSAMVLEDADAWATHVDGANIPEVVLDQARTVHVDATGAVDATITTFLPAETVDATMVLDRTSDLAVVSLLLLGGGAQLGGVPSEPVSVGTFDLSFRHVLLPPGEDPLAGTAAYLFQITRNHPGQIPDDLSYAATPQSTTRIRTDYDAMASGDRMAVSTLTAWTERMGLGIGLPVQVPRLRNEYVNAEEGVQWSGSVDPFLGAGALDMLEPYVTVPGGRVAVQHLHQIHHHSTQGGYVGYVFGDFFAVETPWLVSDDGHAMYASPWGEGITARTRVWRDGELVADAPEPMVGVELPGGGDVRVQRDTTVDHPDWQRSTQVSSTWDFPITPAGGEEMVEAPLLNVDYGVVGLNDHNARRGATWLKLSVLDGQGAVVDDVDSLKLWFSADRGQTWRPVTISGGGAARNAIVRPPSGASTISLKVEAQAGDRVFTETVTDAWTIRP